MGVSHRNKIVISEPHPLINEEIDLLSKYGDVVLLNTTKEDVLTEAVRDADLLIVDFAKVTKNIIENAQRLKGIIRHGIGVDNIDLETATRRGIVVANIPDYSTKTVADHTWALILALTRKIVIADKYVRDKLYVGRWENPPEYLKGLELEGKVLGIIGFGRIGREVAKRAQGFGLKVLAYSRHISEEIAREFGAVPANLETILRESDIITLHVPLTKETYHLINEDRIRLMRKKPYIINTSRGAVIDEKALYKALKEGLIAGAALDVFEIEPPPEDNPLFKLDNVIFTPHIAWYSEEALRRLVMTAVEEAARILSGELPKNLVNKDVIQTLRFKKEGA
jgi:D-3-phosphoglycerate dehydrogenase